MKKQTVMILLVLMLCAGISLGQENKIDKIQGDLERKVILYENESLQNKQILGYVMRVIPGNSANETMLEIIDLDSSSIAWHKAMKTKYGTNKIQDAKKNYQIVSKNVKITILIKDKAGQLYFDGKNNSGPLADLLGLNKPVKAKEEVIIEKPEKKKVKVKKSSDKKAEKAELERIKREQKREKEIKKAIKKVENQQKGQGQIITELNTKILILEKKLKQFNQGQDKNKTKLEAKKLIKELQVKFEKILKKTDLALSSVKKEITDLKTASESAGTSFSYGLDFVSNYIWRGFDLNPGKQPAIQPSVTWSLGDTGLALNLWCSFALGNSLDDTGWSMAGRHEMDLTASYDFSLSEDVSLSIGFTHYGWYAAKDFTFKDGTSQEFYLSASLNVPLSPSLSVYYDITNGDGIYVSLGVSHSLQIEEKFTVDFSATLGYNGGQWLAETIDPGLSDLTVGIGIPFSLKEVSVSVFANYTAVLLDIPDKVNYFWFGISISK